MIISLTIAQNEDVIEQFLKENPSAGRISMLLVISCVWIFFNASAIIFYPWASLWSISQNLIQTSMCWVVVKKNVILYMVFISSFNSIYYFSDCILYTRWCARDLKCHITSMVAVLCISLTIVKMLVTRYETINLDIDLFFFYLPNV